MCGFPFHHMSEFRPPWAAVVWAFGLLTIGSAADPVIPGTGVMIAGVGDDLEDPNWSYQPNFPKSSRNIDERENGPLGRSANRRWLEGPHRGTPDILERVPTPEGGLPGSEGSLLIRTLRPGIPGRTSAMSQQDDIMVSIDKRLGRSIKVSERPNCVVRVYVPPFEQWEDRTGASFGFRTDVWGTKPGQFKVEQYWPGIFINYRAARHSKDRRPSAYLTIRGDALGHDIRGPEVRPGWWTMGLSVSADGMCHFYAREGLEDLSQEDHLASYFCYGYRARHMDLFFFNVLTQDNGKVWSTPWIIDDPTFFAAEDIPLPAPARKKPVKQARNSNRSRSR